MSVHIANQKIKKEWTDYNNHMNMAYYIQCFEESSDYILEMLKIGYLYSTEEKKGVFVIKCNINYRNEIKLNETFSITLNDIKIYGKKLNIDLVMKDSNNKIIAEYNILNLNVDLITKKTCNFDNKILEKIN